MWVGISRTLFCHWRIVNAFLGTPINTRHALNTVVSPFGLVVNLFNIISGAYSDANIAAITVFIRAEENMRKQQEKVK